MASPFEVGHTVSELKHLAECIKSLTSEMRIVMEYTGSYCQLIARFLHNKEFFVSVVYALLVHDFGNNTIRKVKTDKADIARFDHKGVLVCFAGLDAPPLSPAVSRLILDLC